MPRPLVDPAYVPPCTACQPKPLGSALADQRRNLAFLPSVPPLVLPAAIATSPADEFASTTPLLVVYASLSLLGVLLGVVLGFRVARRVH